MLPGFISYYIGLSNNDIKLKMSKKQKIYYFLKEGIIGGLFCAMGALLILVIIGICISFFGEIIRDQIKENLIQFNLIVGIIIILMGFLMLTKYNIILPFKIKNAPIRKGYYGLFLYGILYALVSISCVIPLFIGLVLRAIYSSNILEGFLVFFSFALGLSILFIIITILTLGAKKAIIKHINKILPKIQKIGSIILIIVGIWIIYNYFNTILLIIKIIK
jgi:cytochrome c biogenesis protein CcdA